ncbi:MAG: glycogen debranching protein [Bacteroidota bacterium]
MKRIVFSFILLCLMSCTSEKSLESIGHILSESPSLTGKPEYLDSPFVTAGNRVYMVGHQDGSFPELGWHIKDEMGGIWNHPIKLMDGFDLHLVWKDQTAILNKAQTFVNYPFANSQEYLIPEKDLKIVRYQFVPDDKEGLVVQYLLENTGKTVQDLKVQFVGHTDLRPTWLGERTQMVDSIDSGQYNPRLDAWTVKDSGNPWYVLFGADQKSERHCEAYNSYAGKGISRQLEYSLSLASGNEKTLTFFVAGSYSSGKAAEETYANLRANAFTYLSAKKERYRALAEKTKLTIPDKKMQEAFEWLKYNCDWLVRTVPEIGTGITAGIPDYPWWFGVDSEYALKGYMAIGQTDAVYSTIRLLDSVSNAVNGNGKIIHEMSSNGAVFNDGNINETPQFASLIWDMYLWNGDKAFLKTYFPNIKKGLHWLMAKNDGNKNGFPDGFGMMEIHGLDSEMIDVATYTQRAFADASKIAAELGDTTLSAQYQKIADELKDKINSEFWSEEFNSYADFRGTDAQALHLIKDAIIRADTLNKPWAIAELKQTQKKILKNPAPGTRSFVLHHNWVVNTPMEMGIADSVRAIKALNTAEQFVNPFGVFVTGIDRDVSAGSDDGSFKGGKVFSYTGAVMTLPTGVQAIAENNYGRPDKALEYLKRMTRSFGYALPGSMYEVSPDYGMMVQAWNIYSYAEPIVRQFFGLDPRASEKRISITPQMPSDWDRASLENVAIGDNEISIYYTMINGVLDIKVSQTDPDWEIKVVLPKKASISYSTEMESARTLESKHKVTFIGKGALVQIESEFH